MKNKVTIDREIRLLRYWGGLLAVVNGLLLATMPWLFIAVNRLLQREPPFLVGFGALELLVFFDPIWAAFLLPALFVFGLGGVSFLIDAYPRRFPPGHAAGIATAMASALAFLELVWLYLVFVTLFCRGPSWAFYWPWEAWDEHRVEMLNNINISEWYWVWLLNRPLPGAWPIRELPGFALILLYFAFTPAIAYALYTGAHRTVAYVRWFVILLVLQAMLFVPFKMVLRWWFDIKYIVAVPEYWLNV